MASGDSSKTVKPAQYGLGPRLTFAMQFACKSPSNVIKELDENYGISLGRSAMSKLMRGRVERTRHFMELAEILGVNPRWLATGQETMTDVTGRLSNRDRAVSDVKRLARTHLFPPNRADLIRLHDLMLTNARLGYMDREDVQKIAKLIRSLAKPHKQAAEAAKRPTGDADNIDQDARLDDLES